MNRPCINVVRLPGGSPCGHQHHSHRAAVHCRRLATRTRPVNTGPPNMRGTEYALRVVKP